MKFVLVTGACSEIGKRTIFDLIKENYFVVASDLPAREEEFYNIFRNQTNVDFFGIDIRKRSTVKNIISKIFEKYKIESCVFIIGKNLLVPFFQWDYNKLCDVFELNFIYASLFIKDIAEEFIRRRTEGSFVVISSQHGIVANTQRLPYCVSKSMLSQLCRCLALELSLFNIRVNSISPTFIETKDNCELLNSSYMLLDAKEKIPLQRYASPKDISGAILFLISSRAKMITGHDLVIDGGWTIQ
ncbi:MULTISPECIES: SDR family oxidoreductase [unclassified Streptococcus]|uniref:SDR family oxidoreductase n=1 Tax=unclassified Streptococcus TaxID=2608887 RepID=UPI00359EAAA3